jgi:bifunctional DNA-binding transcriptional regulator/antitoxin component of YhaV-PrlF toxin-antitoxin module
MQVGRSAELDATARATYTESEIRFKTGTFMTVTVKNRTPLVVPPAMRRKAGFKSGQEIEFRASGGVITIAPKLPKADDEYTPEQRRIITAQLAEGLADVKAGRVRGPFATHKEFIASLHEEARKLGRKKTKRST